MERTRLGVDRILLDGEFVVGDAAIAGGTLVEVGLPPDGSGHTATRGFVDLQINGFAGIDFARAGPEDYATVGSALAATGVTSFQPTVITLPWSAYAATVEAAHQARATTPGMLGLHMEGPFLARTHSGAHDPADIVAPTPERVAFVAQQTAVRWVTVAPEVDGGVDAIRALTAAGKVVAIGHSGADAECARLAIDAGATAVTHCFNAQSALSHRAPGIPGVALDDSRVTVTIIVDENHLAPETVRLAFRAAAGRVALITDAIAAAGLGDGPALLGDRSVTVRDGVARLSDGTLAGSTITMDASVRLCRELGVPLEAALEAATTVPARACGLRDLGPGAPADIAILDAELAVVRTLRRGSVIHES